MEPKKESFTFVTYNLDGSKYNREGRLEQFIKLIEQIKPDVVAIQEGTRLTYEKLGREMGKLNYKYKFLDILREKKKGEIVFSQFPLEDYQFIEYTFNAEFEHRGLTIAKINIDGDFYCVATTQCHPTPPIQTKQIAEIPKIVRRYNSEGLSIVLGGDLQLSSFTKIDAPAGWEDVWYDAGNDANKFTCDYEKNILVLSPIKDRSDRVWISGGMECTCFELLGIDSQPNISSHFGILAEINVS